MKAISLLSGGIDSPVAAHLLLERGLDITVIHFDNRPFADDEQFKKTMSLISRLEELHKKGIKSYIVPYEEIHLAFQKYCKRKLHCVLCKRMMLRLAEKIAKMEHADALVTGESLGQVASQTLRNIRVESQSVDLPILRPLIGLDKLEIENMAKEIGTYELSILPGMCCTMVPKRPSTHSQLGIVLQEEMKLDLNALVVKVLKGVWQP